MKRILVIDDNDDFRRLLLLALQSEGYAVDGATNGHAGLECLARRPADAVVTDIFMPGKEGIETIAELRSVAPRMHIVAMSGRTSATDFDPLTIAEELGAAATLRKPFEIEELVAILRRLLAGPA